MANYTQYIYKVQVSEYSDFRELVINDWVESMSDIFDSKELEPATTYYWRVKKVNSMTGKESAWSDTCSFFTKGTDITINVTTQIINFISFGTETECECNHSLEIYTSDCPETSAVDRYTSC
jgi:hypothetical protein